MNAYRRGRSLALVTIGSAVATALSGCAASVPADEVISTIVAQLERQGVTVDDDAVRCPGDDVPAEVGRTLRCGFTAGGQPADAVARVSSVDGNRVNFEITTEARPVPRRLLERTVAGEIAKAGIPLERVTCAGDLAPRIGRTQICTAITGGREKSLTTRVTDVRGASVDFAIEQS